MSLFEEYKLSLSSVQSLHNKNEGKDSKTRALQKEDSYIPRFGLEKALYESRGSSSETLKILERVDWSKPLILMDGFADKNDFYQANSFVTYSPLLAVLRSQNEKAIDEMKPNIFEEINKQKNTEVWSLAMLRTGSLDMIDEAIHFTKLYSKSTGISDSAMKVFLNSLTEEDKEELIEKVPLLLTKNYNNSLSVLAPRIQHPKVVRKVVDWMCEIIPLKIKMEYRQDFKRQMNSQINENIEGLLNNGYYKEAHKMLRTVNENNLLLQGYDQISLSFIKDLNKVKQFWEKKKEKRPQGYQAYLNCMSELKNYYKRVIQNEKNENVSKDFLNIAMNLNVFHHEVTSLLSNKTSQQNIEENMIPAFIEGKIQESSGMDEWFKQDPSSIQTMVANAIEYLATNTKKLSATQKEKKKDFLFEEALANIYQALQKMKVDMNALSWPEIKEKIELISKQKSQATSGLGDESKRQYEENFKSRILGALHEHYLGRMLLPSTTMRGIPSTPTRF